ncbi:hypothetical protein E4T56_gene16921 [Termitomyces sp. T112]|nr:hypothetical protein E4T56_gene16921 [Termitomyces sp. T112]
MRIPKVGEHFRRPLRNRRIPRHSPCTLTSDLGRRRHGAIVVAEVMTMTSRARFHSLALSLSSAAAQSVFPVSLLLFIFFLFTLLCTIEHQPQLGCCRCVVFNPFQYFVYIFSLALPPLPIYFLYYTVSSLHVQLRS